MTADRKEETAERRNDEDRRTIPRTNTKKWGTWPLH